MNRFLFLTLVLLPFAVSAQYGIAQPFKKANVIVVKTEGIAPDSLYKVVARVLLDKGYTIDRSDAALRTLTTARRTHSKQNMISVLSASVKDGAVTLSGKFTTLTAATLGQGELLVDMEYKEGGAFRRSFDELDTVATTLTEQVNGQRTYAFR